MYQFQKTYLESQLCVMAYSNPNFQRGRLDLLQKIERLKKDQPRPAKNQLAEVSESAESEEMTQKETTKLIKVSESQALQAADSSNQNSRSQFLESLEDMMEKASFMFWKYGSPEAKMNLASKPENLETVFSRFSSDLFTLLGFDEIDNEYENMSSPIMAKTSDFQSAFGKN
eukprot:CAMPEP_0176447764 /NCGR_PEP_ID=MMETSP0127-20121128/25265_1 /TAXON_ID=938130 /ORGANISM="Platyophrya macrostoma, Strain WH" /LENGTH=171 /DNA_ID=CAMNT_0017834351 /DNA_START=232 /DNA_END=747 /DNA_ORIENTATION=+